MSASLVLFVVLGLVGAGPDIQFVLTAPAGAQVGGSHQPGAVVPVTISLRSMGAPIPNVRSVQLNLVDSTGQIFNYAIAPGMPESVLAVSPGDCRNAVSIETLKGGNTFTIPAAPESIAVLMADVMVSSKYGSAVAVDVLSADPGLGCAARVVDDLDAVWDNLHSGFAVGALMGGTLTLNTVSVGGEADFTPLPRLAVAPTAGSQALGISCDGSAIVGKAATSLGSEACRWNAALVPRALGGAPDSPMESAAYASSADGSVIVGYGKTPSGWRGFLYSDSRGLEPLSSFAGGGVETAFDISADGSVVCGGRPNQCSSYSPYRWTAGNGFGSLMNCAGPAAAYCMTPDGSVIAGGSFNQNGAFVWSGASPGQWLGDLPGGPNAASLRGITADGATAVGYGSDPSGTHAVWWTQAKGLQVLPNGGEPPNGEYFSTAWAVSPDGSLIVGFTTSDSGREAALWDADRQLSLVRDVLASDGVSTHVGWQLQEAWDLATVCGETIIVGFGTDSSGATRGWRVVLRDVVPTSPDLTHDGAVDGADLGLLLSNWGTSLPCGDLNDDGVIDGADLGLLLSAWTS